MRQVLICVIVLAVIAAVVNIDTPQTDFLQNKIKGTLAYNIDLKGVYSGIQSVFNNLANGKDESDGLDEGVLGAKSFPETEKQEQVDKELEPASAVYTEEGSLVEGMEYNNSEDGQEKAENEEVAENQVESENTESEQVFGGAGYSFIIPVGGIIGSFYGERMHPIKNTILFHKGIDIEAQSGTPIKAAYGGEVLEADKEETYGNYVKLKHIDGLTTLYAHCSKLLVSKGQKVKQGDIIAEVGSTGAAEGPHLHFEVRKDNTAVNPLDYITLSVN